MCVFVQRVTRGTWTTRRAVLQETGAYSPTHEAELDHESNEMGQEQEAGEAVEEAGDGSGGVEGCSPRLHVSRVTCHMPHDTSHTLPVHHPTLLSKGEGGGEGEFSKPDDSGGYMGWYRLFCLQPKWCWCSCT